MNKYPAERLIKVDFPVLGDDDSEKYFEYTEDGTT